MHICLPVHMAMHHVCIWYPQKPGEGVRFRSTGNTVSHIGTETQTQVLYKSSQCFEPLSHLSGREVLNSLASY